MSSKLNGVKAMSADIENNCVLKLHFDHVVTDEDRHALLDAINAHLREIKLRTALLYSHCPAPIKGARCVKECVEDGNCGCDNAEALRP